MTAKDYPVTQPYGWSPDYPLNRGINPATGKEEGFHKGVDYGCPVGTPIVVNGVTIGLSGATGAVTGPHVHVGKWLQGTDTNPGTGGWSFKSAQVTQVSEDPVNGKFVRVQGDGYSWVYLHMSDNTKVKVGQVLQGGTLSKEALTLEEADALYLLAFGPTRHIDKAGIRATVGKPLLQQIQRLRRSAEYKKGRKPS